MYDHTGQIVRATAGRDKGGVFCVVGADREEPAAAGRRKAAEGCPSQAEKAGACGASRARN